MKKLSLITFTITALLFVNVSANAQNSGSRNMQKRDQGNQAGQYNQNQGNSQYGNDNPNLQNDQRNSQYNSRSNEQEQYGERNEGYSRNNHGEQYGRRDDNRHPGFRIVVNSRGRNNNRYNDYYRRSEYNRNCNSYSSRRNNY